MDFKKLLNDAGTKLSRVVQKTEEAFLSVEKTEYDDQYKFMLRKLDLLNLWSDRFMKEATTVLEPNIANRLEDKVMDRLDRKNERATALEIFGSVFEKAAEEFSSLSPDLSKCLNTFGGIEVRVGVTSKEFQKEAIEVYVSKVKEMIDNDLKKFQEERAHLENLRLDFDAARLKVKRSSNDSNRVTLEDSQRKCGNEFNEQLEKNKILFSDVDKLFMRHQTLIKAFVKAQVKYHEECQKELERLDKQL